MQHKENVAVLKTDLNHHLRFGEEEVIAGGEKLSCMGGGTTVTEIPYNEIASIRVEEGTGIDKLVVLRKNGKAEEVAYFTKKKSEEFRKFSKFIEQYIGGGREKRFEFITDEKKDERQGTLKWLMSFMAPYRRRLLLGVTLSIVIAGLNLIPPYLLKILIDSVLLTKNPPKSLFLDLTLILLASYMANALFTGLQVYVLNTTGQEIVNSLRSRLFRHVVNHSSKFIDRMSTGRIISRLTTDVGNTQWLMVWGLPTLTVNFLTIIGIGVILFTLDANLALFVLVPVPFVILLLIRYRRMSHKIYHRNWRRNADVISRFSDVIPNYAAVKAFSKENSETENFDHLLDRLYDSQRSVVKMNMFYWPLIGLITSLATVFIWYVGGQQVMVGRIQIGIIASFIAYLSLFFAPINNLSNVIPFIQQAVTSGERTREVLESKPEITQPADAKKPDLNGDIVLENVFFGYDPFAPVIRGISLICRRGQKIAVAGISGSGKSTIAKLLMRFYDVDEGSVKINGVDVREIDLRYLREGIGYVPQESVLFDATVAQNISYGSSQEAERWKIIAACVAAGIHEEIARMPLAYDTNLGERGTFLSGGQRQRIAIARAILKDPAIVIFDEATSNLDVMNEREVFRAIMNLSRGRTSIFVTHNINEVLSTDRTVVFSEGAIAEEGKTEELIRGNGALARMFSEEMKRMAQFDGYETENGKGMSLADYVNAYRMDATRMKVSECPRKSRVTVLNGGNMLYESLTPKLAFPISAPCFVMFYGDDGRMQFFIDDLNLIEPDSLMVLKNALKLNNFKVRISSVNDIKLNGEELEWHVSAESGEELTFITRGRRNVMNVGNKMELIDIYDNLYEIDLAAVDRKSARRVQQIF
jgi:ATP-binding cassette subfamily C protein